MENPHYKGGYDGEEQEPDIHGQAQKGAGHERDAHAVLRLHSLVVEDRKRHKREE